MSEVKTTNDTLRLFEQRAKTLGQAAADVDSVLKDNEKVTQIAPSMCHDLEKARDILKAVAESMLKANYEIEARLKRNPNELADLAIENILDIAENGTDEDFEGMLKILTK